jgi:hypothetical protein
MAREGQLRSIQPFALKDKENKKNKKNDSSTTEKKKKRKTETAN